MPCGVAHNPSLADELVITVPSNGVITAILQTAAQQRTRLTSMHLHGSAAVTGSQRGNLRLCSTILQWNYQPRSCL